MKALISTVLLLVGCLFTDTLAQDVKRQIVVPLSQPGERGRLKIDQINGDITVEAYEGKEVIIDVMSKNFPLSKEKREAPAGMRRIASSSLGLTAKEDGNAVDVETSFWKGKMNLSIQVPRNFDLELSTVHGEIVVTNVQGSHELSGVNGGISLNQVEGTALCNTVNGDVVATFGSVIENEPMSFVTLNGDIDVTLPASVKAMAKMKTEQGEIFSDFDMELKDYKPEISRSERCRDCEYKVSLDSWTYGAINDGGGELTFKNMNGDILIRKGQ